jgi:uncharacterized protein (TIGR02453 family)
MTAPHFPPEGTIFLRALAAHNERTWFTEHKDDYETAIKKPAVFLAEAIAAELESVTGAAFQSKVFRINRDLRFAKDKTPYNTHVRMAFWSTGRSIKNPQTGPAFYLSIELDEIVLGAGSLVFSPLMLTRFRRAIADPTTAQDLQAVLDALTTDGHRVSEPELKRTPAGFEGTDAITATLALHKSLGAWAHHRCGTPPHGIHAQDCVAAFSKLKPLYAWLERELLD